MPSTTLEASPGWTSLLSYRPMTSAWADLETMMPVVPWTYDGRVEVERNETKSEGKERQ